MNGKIERVYTSASFHPGRQFVNVLVGGEIPKNAPTHFGTATHIII